MGLCEVERVQAGNYRTVAKEHLVHVLEGEVDLGLHLAVGGHAEDSLRGGEGLDDRLCEVLEGVSVAEGDAADPLDAAPEGVNLRVLEVVELVEADFDVDRLDVADRKVLAAHHLDSEESGDVPQGDVADGGRVATLDRELLVAGGGGKRVLNQVALLLVVLDGGEIEGSDGDEGHVDHVLLEQALPDIPKVNELVISGKVVRLPAGLENKVIWGTKN